MAWTWRKRYRPRRTIETAALDGKKNHETLYGALARSAHGWKICTCILLAVVAWDRIERWPLLAEKQYVPVVMAEHQDGSLRFVGEPDPTWRPIDVHVLDDLSWALQTLRGRTKDAQFDQQLWQRLVTRVTEKGLTKMAVAYQQIQDITEKGRITIRTISINKLSELTFDVRWEEKRENLQGAQVGPLLYYRGLFTFLIDVPTTLVGLRQNQKGVWLDDWSIAEDKL